MLASTPINNNLDGILSQLRLHWGQGCGVHVINLLFQAEYRNFRNGDEHVSQFLLCLTKNILLLP